MIKIKPNTYYKVASQDLEHMQRDGLQGATLFFCIIAYIVCCLDETKAISLYDVLILTFIGFHAGAHFQRYMTPRMLHAKEIPNAESTTPEGRGPENNNP